MCDGDHAKVAVYRRFARDCAMQGCAHGIKVTGRGLRASLYIELLRGIAVLYDRQLFRQQARDLAFVTTRRAKVDQQRCTVRLDNDVIWRDVAVKDALRMHVFQGL